ncbi:hypothetical protein Tco_1512095, partial [Tanacetum coccineum]
MGSFIATVITVREATFKVKYLQGNHSFLFFKPCNKSTTIARMQNRDATAMYIPIHDIVLNERYGRSILGIKIKRENKGIVISQPHYIEKILKKFNREDCSPVNTPMDSVEKLKPNTGKHVDQLEYSRAIGCLMYAMISTRPDIAYAVGRLSRFTSNPSRQHWQAIT